MRRVLSGVDFQNEDMSSAKLLHFITSILTCQGIKYILSCANPFLNYDNLIGRKE